MIGGECGAGMQCWGNGQGKNWCCFPSGAKPNDFLAKGQVQWGAKACCNGEWMDMGMGQHRVFGLTDHRARSLGASARTSTEVSGLLRETLLGTASAPEMGIGSGVRRQKQALALCDFCGLQVFGARRTGQDSGEVVPLDATRKGASYLAAAWQKRQPDGCIFG
eukprot:s2520_g5.t2